MGVIYYKSNRFKITNRVALERRLSRRGLSLIHMGAGLVHIEGETQLESPAAEEVWNWITDHLVEGWTAVLLELVVNRHVCFLDSHVLHLGHSPHTVRLFHGGTTKRLRGRLGSYLSRLELVNAPYTEVEA